jgi:flagellar FliL protein
MWTSTAQKAGEEGGGKKPPLRLIIIAAAAAVLLLGGGVGPISSSSASRRKQRRARLRRRARKGRKKGAEGEKKGRRSCGEWSGGHHYRRAGWGCFLHPAQHGGEYAGRGDGRPVYLKLKLTLEAPDQATAEMIQPANAPDSGICSKVSFGNCVRRTFRGLRVPSSCEWRFFVGSTL